MLALPVVGQVVVIDRLVQDDAAALSVSHSHPDNARYQGWRSPLSEADALHFIDTHADTEPLAPGRKAQLAIREERKGPLAGDLYLARPETAPSAVEVGITLAPGFQRRGLASGAITAVVDMSDVDLAIDCFRAGELNPIKYPPSVPGRAHRLGVHGPLGWPRGL